MCRANGRAAAFTRVRVSDGHIRKQKNIFTVKKTLDVRMSVRPVVSFGIAKVQNVVVKIHALYWRMTTIFGIAVDCGRLLRRTGPSRRTPTGMPNAFWSGCNSRWASVPNRQPGPGVLRSARMRGRWGWMCAFTSFIRSTEARKATPTTYRPYVEVADGSSEKRGLPV